MSLLDIKPMIALVLASAVAVSMAAGGGYYRGQLKGRDVVRKQWQEDVDKRNAASIKALQDAAAENDAIRQHDEAKNQEVIRGYEQENATLRLAANERKPGLLRLPAAVCASHPNTAAAQAASPGAVDEAAAGPVALPDQIAGNLYGLTGEADALSAQLRALQSWINAQGFGGAYVQAKFSAR